MRASCPCGVRELAFFLEHTLSIAHLAVSTVHNRSTARILISPAVGLLLLWMLIPLGMTIYFSFLRFNLLRPGVSWDGLGNYRYFTTDPDFFPAIANTLVLVGGVIGITTVGGVILGILLNKEFWGRSIVRLLIITPFFVMPTVSALVWKNMFLNPVNGIFGYLARVFGVPPIDFLAQYSLESIIGIVAWQWLPFATLILLTALQSLDQDQVEAAEMDGASRLSRFWFVVLPHLARPLTAVVLIETIFMLSIFAEIFVTTSGGPGSTSTNLPWLIYRTGRLGSDIGAAAAGGIIAVVMANIVAIFLLRMIGKNLDR